jgi:signal transduction histidine kinase
MRLEYIFDSLSSGLLAVDNANRVLFLNRILGQRLGVERGAWIGRPVEELFRKISAQVENPEALRQRLNWRAAPNAWRSEEIIWKEGESVRHLREDSGPLRDESGAVIGRLFAYHDISREKAIDQMKTEFIAVASHELRTPMTSIKGSVDLILSGFAGDISAETQELLEIAKKSCDRLIRLINDILDLSKIEAGQIKLRLMPLDLTDAVERSISSVRSLAEMSEVQLRLVRPVELPQVEVDKDRIEQVVTNLLSNAIKFSPPKGEVRVELSVVHDDAASSSLSRVPSSLSPCWVECAVVDCGSGIAEENLERVFGKFQQVGETRRQGGTGLGLAIAQALVHEHHGKIWVESKLNEGARFIFRLPAAQHSASPGL